MNSHHSKTAVQGRGLQCSLCVRRGLRSSALNHVYCAAGMPALCGAPEAEEHKRVPRPSVLLDSAFLSRLTVVQQINKL
jgi:hypothetical protein